MRFVVSFDNVTNFAVIMGGTIFVQTKTSWPMTNSQSKRQSYSSIRDNLERGSVGKFLKEKIEDGSKLSIVSAYFTIYAYAALKPRLDNINELRFLFGEPRFVKSLDPEKSETKAYEIIDAGLELYNQLQQKTVAKECAQWIQDKVAIRSMRQSSLLHGKLYHLTNTTTRLLKACVKTCDYVRDLT